MRNVVFFVTGLDSGGLENYLLRFLQYKAAFIGDITIFCKGGKGGQLENEFLKIPNVTIVKKNIGYYSYNDYKLILDFFLKNRFDAVCDFTGNFSGLVLKMASKAKIGKRIVFYRGATDRFKESIYKKIYNNIVKRFVYKYATSILSNSQAAFDYFFEDFKKDSRFKVIYNGIDGNKFGVGCECLRERMDIPPDAFVIGHTGRFHFAKNHRVIINVAEVIINRHDDVYFILCGNGVKDNLQKIVDEKLLGKRILLFENRRDIPSFLNTMNVYFFPSVTEGQPNALIEAMTFGLPFVASNIKPIKETVGENYYNNLCDPMDIDGFIEKLEFLKSNYKGRDLQLKEDSIKRYDYKDLFNQFYHELV